MENTLRIPTRTSVPNPHYSALAEEQSKKTNQPYPVPKEIEEVKYTQITVRGLPDIVRKITEYITSNFEVE